jgi:hypothetical protein
MQERVSQPGGQGRGVPGLPGKVSVRDDSDMAIDALLADVFIHASNCVRSFGDFHLAVSATPESEPVLMRLMYDLNYRDFPWKRTRLWMVDEVLAAEEDLRCRRTRLAETIVACSGIPESQFHRMDPASPNAAHEYVSVLREHLGWRERGHDRLDCVLLTVDESGKVSGLGAEPDTVSIGTVFIRGARLVAVYAGGVAQPAGGGADAALAAGGAAILANGAEPVGGELVWYLARGVEKGVPLADDGRETRSAI